MTSINFGVSQIYTPRSPAHFCHPWISIHSSSVSPLLNRGVVVVGNGLCRHTRPAVFSGSSWGTVSWRLGSWPVGFFLVAGLQGWSWCPARQQTDPGRAWSPLAQAFRKEARHGQACRPLNSQAASCAAYLHCTGNIVVPMVWSLFKISVSFLNT